MIAPRPSNYSTHFSNNTTNAVERPKSILASPLPSSIPSQYFPIFVAFMKAARSSTFFA
jgi:hypothetical protein